MTNSSKTNVVDFSSRKEMQVLLDTEQEVIETLLKEGFFNPKEDEGLNKTLEFSFRGKKYRRFMLKFGLLEQDSLEESQVRDKEFDEDYCNEQLIPLIVKHGLRYPIFTSNSAGLPTEKIDAGHNRNWSWAQINKENPVPIPRILISDPYFVDDGVLKKITPENLEFFSTVSRIVGNPKPPNNVYTMQSVAVQIKELFNKDPTLGGINPTRQWFASKSSEVLYLLMDEIHPEQFLRSNERTKIYNFLTTKKHNKIKPVTNESITSDLVNLDWQNGLYVNKKGNKKRYTFTDHVDYEKDAYIGLVDNNQINFRTVVLTNLVRIVGLKQKPKASKVFLHCKIQDPVANNKELNQQRLNFLQEVVEYNKIATNFKLPLVEKAYFAKQLLDTLDTGKYYELKDGKFEESEI